jgi:hypothetical protein
MTKKNLTKADLRQFTGSEHWYRHHLVRKILYTDGAQYVAEHGDAHWLLDEISFAQSLANVAAERFQVWELSVAINRTAGLVCSDGNGRVAYVKTLDWTDFPLDEISFYFIDNTILLPSEY